MILDERAFDSFEDWAERIAMPLYQYGNVPSIVSYKQWKNWAYDVVQISAIAAQNPPSPKDYGDWRSWASAFNQAVTLQTG